MEGSYWELYVECRGGKEYIEYAAYSGEKAFSDEEHEMEEYILGKHADEGPMFYRATLIEEEKPEKPEGQVPYSKWCLMNQHEFLD